MSTSNSKSLDVTLARAISYLTRPLIVSYPEPIITKLQLVLDANLSSFFAATWTPNDPLHGSGRRCLTLSPKCLPPRVIYSACLASGVQWFDWIALLGGREFDLFIDPGCVSTRFGKKGNPSSPLIIVWSDERPVPPPLDLNLEGDSVKAQIGARAHILPVVRGKTFAQQLLEADKREDEELFAMLADEISAPSWMTPVCDRFPVSARTSSPLSAISSHSRSSSRSSNSSSCFSFGSSSSDSYGSSTTVSTFSSSSPVERPQSKQSRREKARFTRVYVDTTKTEVTPYDGGKTTVLTGGVMLGGPKVARPTSTVSNNWRSIRA
jgi:BTG family